MEAAVTNSFRASLVDLTSWLWFLKPGVGQYSHPILFKTFIFFWLWCGGLLISRGSYRWSFWWTVILCCLLVVCTYLHDYFSRHVTNAIHHRTAPLLKKSRCFAICYFHKLLLYYFVQQWWGLSLQSLQGCVTSQTELPSPSPRAVRHRQIIHSAFLFS